LLGHALQHLDQVRVRVDVVQPAGGDQALYHPDQCCADLGPAEQLIAPAQRNHTQRTPDVVRFEGYFGVVEEDLQF
jgi:hypothetical protein